MGRWEGVRPFMETKTDPKAVDALQALTVMIADLKDELTDWRPMIDRLRAQLAQDGRAQEEQHAAAIMTLEDQIDRLHTRLLFWRRIAMLFIGVTVLFVGLRLGWR
jgi:hypothetical protein